MKTAKFTYKKDSEITNREILIMDEASEHIGGLDFSLMNDAEKKVINEAIDEMYNKLRPYTKYYRKFLKNKIQGDILQEVIKSTK